MRERGAGASRGLFDQEVAAYDRARPSYPDPLFDDLTAYLLEGGITGPIRTVEIGPGTGKATASLLVRGYRVTAVEHGAEMSAFLREKFAGETALTVLHAPFEEAPLSDGAFDAVISATSFHWIDPDVRLRKAHRILCDGGVLAVIDTNQIASDADRGFFDRCFPIYLKYRPDEKNTPVQGAHGVTPPALAEIAQSALFTDARLHRYRHDQTYPTHVYADLVRSYSNTQMMPRDAREALISDLCALIDAEFDGYVVRPLVITLVLARKR